MLAASRRHHLRFSVTVRETKQVQQAMAKRGCPGSVILLFWIRSLRASRPRQEDTLGDTKERSAHQRPNKP